MEDHFFAFEFYVFDDFVEASGDSFEGFEGPGEHKLFESCGGEVEPP